MNSKEISIWLDERWYNAIQRNHPGQTMEELVGYFIDSLKLQLPKDELERITQEIQQEDRQRAAEAEADRRFSVARVTEHGEAGIYLAENGEDLYQAAQRLRRYLRGEALTPGKLYPDTSRATEQQMEQCVAEAISGSPRVVGAFDIDLDKGVLSSLNSVDGWHSFRVKDVSTAIYFATKNQSLYWRTKHEQFYARLDGKELPDRTRPVLIRGQQPLPVESLFFEDEVSQMDNLLNFYVPVHFDPDGVFGTNVATDQNDDWLNVYANYDLENGRVCDTLDVCLMRGAGSELACEYRLSPEERAALLPKMDSYCQEQMGITLDGARAQYLEEEQEAASSPPLLSQVERDRQEMHRKVDARYDALVRKAVLGDESGSARLVPMREDLSSLKGEKPSAVILPDGTAVAVKTWRQAAQVIVQDCCADPERRERLMELRGKLHGNLRTLLSDTPRGMDVPLEITDGLYMEGKFDTGALFRMLTEKILPQAGYDYQGTMLQIREPELEQTQEQAPVQGMGMSQTM